MAQYRQVHCMFWNDPEVQDFTTDEKLFYLYLLTNPRSRQCGISEISIKQMSFETGLSIKSIDTLLIRFESMGKIKYSKKSNEVALKNWRKYNPDTSPKVKTCINKELLLVKDTALIQYLYSIDTPTQEEGEREEEEKYNNNEKEGEKETPVRTFPFECMQLATLLYEQILTNNDKFKKPNLDNWASDIDKLHRIDLQSYEDIQSVILWCQTKGNFWVPNIQSGKKLREKFDRLLTEMKNDRVKSNGKSNGNSIGTILDNSNKLREALEQQQRGFDSGL